MFHEEIINFLIKKKDISFEEDEENKDLISHNMDNITEKLLDYLTIITANKVVSNIMLQEFIELSSKIRNHIPIKVEILLSGDFEFFSVNDVFKNKELLFCLKTILENYLTENDLNKKINVNIKDLRGDIKNINIPTSANDLKLKKFISEYSGKEVEEIILIYNGKALNDDKLFYFINIKEEDTIHLIFKKIIKII